MRRLLSLFALLALLGGLFALAGCGGGEAGLVSGTPSATGTMSVKVGWPARASSRMIPQAAMRLEMKVTCPGITDPIVGSITRPETVLSLAVPVGTGRSVEVIAYDETDTAIAHGSQGDLTVAANKTTAVTITLVGMEDPNDYWSTPIQLTFDEFGVASAEALIDSRADGDDNFVFDAKEGMGYTVTFEPLEVGLAPINSNSYFNINASGIGAMDCAWDSEFSVFNSGTMVITAPTADPIHLGVTYNSYYWDYANAAARYKITVTEGGEGGIDATVQ